RRAAERGVKIEIFLPPWPEENLDLPNRISLFTQNKVLRSLSTFTNVLVRSPRKKLQPYIHAKLLVADEHVTILGSANANGRSLDGKCDSELDVVVEDAKFSKELLEQLKRRQEQWQLQPDTLEEE